MWSAIIQPFSCSHDLTVAMVTGGQQRIMQICYTTRADGARYKVNGFGSLFIWNVCK